jgi:hypothetical protein
MRNYADSVAFCAGEGATIASIHNDQENEDVLAMIQEQGCYAYLGAESFGTGTWSWNDGSPWDYVSPLNDGINGVGEHHIAYQTNGEWHDWGTGSSTHGVVCKLPGGDVCQDTYTADAANDYHIYEQPLGSSKTVVFDVQAGNDAHVGFFSDAASSGEVYEIVISGWGNQQSVIRECNQCANQVTVATPGLLDANSPTSFWADAIGGNVRLGTGSDVGENILMQWQDPAHHEAVYVGVMTGWGSDGQWNVCHDGWGTGGSGMGGTAMTFPPAYNSGLGGDIGVSAAKSMRL